LPQCKNASWAQRIPTPAAKRKVRDAKKSSETFPVAQEPKVIKRVEMSSGGMKTKFQAIYGVYVTQA
jgi:hypothetical protein